MLHENLQALELDAKTIKKRQVEFIDIAMDPVENYAEHEDPMKFKSVKTGRGPLQEGWQVGMNPSDSDCIHSAFTRFGSL